MENDFWKLEKNWESQLKQFKKLTILQLKNELSIQYNLLSLVVCSLKSFRWSWLVLDRVCHQKWSDTFFAAWTIVFAKQLIHLKRLWTLKDLWHRKHREELTFLLRKCQKWACRGVMLDMIISFERNGKTLHYIVQYNMNSDENGLYQFGFRFIRAYICLASILLRLQNVWWRGSHYVDMITCPK